MDCFEVDFDHPSIFLALSERLLTLHTLRIRQSDFANWYTEKHGLEDGIWVYLIDMPFAWFKSLSIDDSLYTIEGHEYPTSVYIKVITAQRIYFFKHHHKSNEERLLELEYDNYRGFQKLILERSLQFLDQNINKN